MWNSSQLIFDVTGIYYLVIADYTENIFGQRLITTILNIIRLI